MTDSCPCSCGELIHFEVNESTGSNVPICEHGTNHFLDCPDRVRYRKAYGIPPAAQDRAVPGQKSLEAWR